MRSSGQGTFYCLNRKQNDSSVVPSIKEVLEEGIKGQDHSSSSSMDFLYLFSFSSLEEGTTYKVYCTGKDLYDLPTVSSIEESSYQYTTTRMPFSTCSIASSWFSTTGGPVWVILYLWYWMERTGLFRPRTMQEQPMWVWYLLIPLSRIDVIPPSRVRFVLCYNARWSFDPILPILWFISVWTWSLTTMIITIMIPMTRTTRPLAGYRRKNESTNKRGLRSVWNTVEEWGTSAVWGHSIPCASDLHSCLECSQAAHWLYLYLQGRPRGYVCSVCEHAGQTAAGKLEYLSKHTESVCISLCFLFYHRWPSLWRRRRVRRYYSASLNTTSLLRHFSLLNLMVWWSRRTMYDNTFIVTL